MADLKSLQEELLPYKDTLVLYHFKIVKLVDVIDGEDDYYWVYDTKHGIIHSSCVIGWIPLKGVLPDNNYNHILRIWNLKQNIKIIVY